MKTKLLAVTLCFVSANLPTVLHAEGNAAAGKEKAASCTSCHGDNGNSMVSTFPKLAQQHSSYIVKQLKAFKEGIRKDPVMSGLAANLSDDDMYDIGAYYASQKISVNTPPVLNTDDDDDDTTETSDADKKAKNDAAVEALITQGHGLYRNGDLEREVSACIACHGPYGEGNKPAAFPAVASQHADYLIKSLNDFKAGTRSNIPGTIMQMHMIAKKMTDEEIKAVSYYMSMMK